MSFTRRDVEDRLRDFVVEAYPGIPWIFANQPGDRPPRPYGTIRVGAANPIGQGEPELEEVAGGEAIIERMREVYEIEVSFQAFTNGSPNAVDVLTAVKAHARRPSTLIAQKNGLFLGFMSAGEVRSLSEVVQADWEGRAQLDALFSARVDDERTVPTVAVVEISGAGGTQTVEVP